MPLSAKRQTGKEDQGGEDHDRSCRRQVPEGGRHEPGSNREHRDQCGKPDRLAKASRDLQPCGGRDDDHGGHQEDADHLHGQDDGDGAQDGQDRIQIWLYIRPMELA